jgi:hypothetical protein
VRASYAVPVARLLLVLTAAIVISGGAAAAASSPLLIRGDASVGGLLIGHGSPAAARSQFGKASTTRSLLPSASAISWKRLGLTLTFLELSGGAACKTGALVTATVTNRAHWRTLVGLRVGDSVARLKQLYPRAVLTSAVVWRGYWLITRHTCVEVGGAPFPGLLARVRHGRVSALVAGTTACE